MSVLKPVLWISESVYDFHSHTSKGQGIQLTSVALSEHTVACLCNLVAPMRSVRCFGFHETVVRRVLVEFKESVKTIFVSRFVEEVLRAQGRDLLISKCIIST